MSMPERESGRDTVPSGAVGRPWGSPRQRAAVWTSLTLLIAVLLFLYRYLELVADGERADWRPVLINEFTAVTALACLLGWWVLPWMRRHRLTGRTWFREVPAYLVVLLLLSVTHTSINWGARTLAYRTVGLPPFDYGAMPARYLMEFPLDALALGLAVIIAHLLWSSADARARDLQAEQLERALTESRLQSLRLQLQPHFLFNALNTVSSVMYDDVPRADRILGHLSALLRASLTAREVQEVTLTEELGALDHYLEIVRARFGGRCDIRVDVPTSVQDAAVPSLLLQPLVENAVRHGGLERTGRGRIAVKGWRTEDALLLEVRDDGAGTTGDGTTGHGVGLGVTRDRLRLLYGDAQEVRAGITDGEFVVTLRLPYREVRDA